jgi:hypothetical protein
MSLKNKFPHLFCLPLSLSLPIPAAHNPAVICFFKILFLNRSGNTSEAHTAPSTCITLSYSQLYLSSIHPFSIASLYYAVGFPSVSLSCPGPKVDPLVFPESWATFPHRVINNKLPFSPPQLSRTRGRSSGFPESQATFSHRAIKQKGFPSVSLGCPRPKINPLFSPKS